MPSVTLAILQVQLIRSGASDEHPFAQPILNIGRASDNDIVLEDPLVSGHHLRIELAGEGKATVTDLGSTNGVQLNGQPVWPKTPTPLRFGDVLDLVEFRLALRPYEAGGIAAVAERVRIAVQAKPGLAAFVGGKVFKVPLTKPVTTVGRATDNDIVLEHPLVSRHHAQITRQEDGDYLIADLGSANGLTLHGHRVPQRLLADGDALTIGPTNEVALQFRASIGFLPVEGPRKGTKAPHKAVEPADQLKPAQPAAPMTGQLNLKGMESISIGRASDNRIVLDHPASEPPSRAHRADGHALSHPRPQEFQRRVRQRRAHRPRGVAEGRRRNPHRLDKVGAARGWHPAIRRRRSAAGRRAAEQVGRQRQESACKTFRFRSCRKNLSRSSV